MLKKQGLQIPVKLTQALVVSSRAVYLGLPEGFRAAHDVAMGNGVQARFEGMNRTVIRLHAMQVWELA
ncbi:MAG: hypothetical protein KME20_05370 [Kaiparowitsia implicata GSE-PSE-MK54-09C]|jgi:hypothetical protein|nr:hypothetical protein [Kaiparowitsia implicata GSE-PSE-MK54-09C]